MKPDLVPVHAMQTKPKWKQLLERERPLLLPCAHDALSARLIERAGFAAYSIGGFPLVGARHALPDVGLVGFGEMSAGIRDIMAATDLPVLVDGDDGYGDAKNVARTVAGYEAMGVAAIFIEDQRAPKRCGHMAGKEVIDADTMAAKLQAAAAARRNPDTFIIARTDARTAHGLDEALRRAKLYEEAGADVIFVESPESEAELERIGKEVSKPLLANMVEFGKTPRVEADRLKKWGFDIAIYPGLGFSVAAEAMRQAWSYLKDKGTSAGIEVPQYRGMHELMGFPEVWDFEKRWVS